MNRIKELINNDTRTMKEISDILEIPYSTLSNFANRGTKPKHDNLLKLAKYFNVEPSEILGLTVITGKGYKKTSLYEQFHLDNENEPIKVSPYDSLEDWILELLDNHREIINDVNFNETIYEYASSNLNALLRLDTIKIFKEILDNIPLDADACYELGELRSLIISIQKLISIKK